VKTENVLVKKIKTARTGRENRKCPGKTGLLVTLTKSKVSGALRVLSDAILSACLQIQSEQRAYT